MLVVVENCNSVDDKEKWIRIAETVYLANYIGPPSP